jgi:hypothetical protein
LCVPADKRCREGACPRLSSFGLLHSEGFKRRRIEGTLSIDVYIVSMITITTEMMQTILAHPRGVLLCELQLVVAVLTTRAVTPMLLDVRLEVVLLFVAGAVVFHGVNAREVAAAFSVPEAK